MCRKCYQYFLSLNFTIKSATLLFAATQIQTQLFGVPSGKQVLLTFWVGSAATKVVFLL